MIFRILLVGFIAVLLLSAIIGGWRHAVAIPSLYTGIVFLFIRYPFLQEAPLEYDEDLHPGWEVRYELYGDYLITAIQVVHIETKKQRTIQLDEDNYTRNPCGYLRRIKSEILAEISIEENNISFGTYEFEPRITSQTTRKNEEPIKRLPQGSHKRRKNGIHA